MTRARRPARVPDEGEQIGLDVQERLGRPSHPPASGSDRRRHGVAGCCHVFGVSGIGISHSALLPGTLTGARLRQRAPSRALLKQDSTAIPKAAWRR
jgi:hypothetical protein